jgi:hypothetical protein
MDIKDGEPRNIYSLNALVEHAIVEPVRRTGERSSGAPSRSRLLYWLSERIRTGTIVGDLSADVLLKA